MKKVLKILALIMLILTIFEISQTYSKYFTKGTAVIEQEIGKWKIQLNKVDIYSEKGEALEFVMEPETLSEYTSQGAIAPGSSLYSEITIDPTGTDVAVKYDIKFDLSNVKANGLELEAQIQSEDATGGAKKQLTKTGEGTYTAILTLEEVQSGTPDVIGCTVKWQNDESKNAEDTEKGSTYGQQVQIPVVITCVQYLGEKIQ